LKLDGRGASETLAAVPCRGYTPMVWQRGLWIRQIGRHLFRPRTAAGLTSGLPTDSTAQRNVHPPYPPAKRIGITHASEAIGKMQHQSYGRKPRRNTLSSLFSGEPRDRPKIPSRSTLRALIGVKNPSPFGEIRLRARQGCERVTANGPRVAGARRSSGAPTLDQAGSCDVSCVLGD
jgi:hypothetical protein